MMETGLHPITALSPEAPLFSASLVSTSIQESLPEGYTMRPLQRSDFKNGHLDVLADLAYMGEISEEAWTDRFDWMNKRDGTYYILVIAEPEGKLVATGTLVVEKKFLNKLGTQGHIEDVAVKSNAQGKKFGLKLLQGLDHIGKEVGCYKNILDCSPGKDGFYVKCGYEQAGIEMHHYFDHEAEEHGV